MFWLKLTNNYSNVNELEKLFLGSFPTKHSATVEELHKGEYEVGGGGVIPLEILDTSGIYFSYLVIDWYFISIKISQIYI